MRWLLGLLAVLALAGCDAEPAAEEATPAIWEVSGPDGERGWLLGTIHALPANIEWQNDTVVRLVDEADALALEITEFEDATLFPRYAQSAGQGSLIGRVEPPSRRDAERLLDETGFDDADFASVETWAASLMLAAPLFDGDTANGVDRILLGLWQNAGKPDGSLVELEGVERQFAVFDGLPEAAQREMLASVIHDFSTPEDESAELRMAWQSGDLGQLEEAAKSGMLADPFLRAALLDDRNRDMAEKAARLMERGKATLIAVGAAHMVGETGLAALLQERGYTVTRIQ